MRIRYFLPLFVILVLSLCGCQDDRPKNSGPAFAVVDMMRVMRDSAPGKGGVQYLEKIQAGMQKELDGIQARLEKDPKDEKAMQDLQKVYASSQQRMQAEQQNVVNMLNDTIQRVLSRYRDAHGYDIIIASDAAMAYSPRADVTTAIIEEVDREKVEFKPVTEAPAAQATPEAAQEAAPADGGKADKSE